MRSNPFQSFLWVVPLSVLILSGISSPLPDPEASPSPQYQYLPPSRSSQSSQQFTMYKPIQIQLGYPSPGTNSAGGRTDANGNPLHPIFTYNYNISHPPKTPLQSARNQFFNQQQQNPSQQGSPLAQQYQRQFQRNQNYAPVIIANPNFNQPNLQSQNLISGSGNYGSAQFYVNSEREREPEDDDISFRTRNRNGRLKAFDDNTRNKIVFDQRLPNERFLNQVQQYPDNIVFSNGQNQLSNPANRQSFGYNFAQSTTPPPIKVPYITTPSALKTIQQLSQNKQQAFAENTVNSEDPSEIIITVVDESVDGDEKGKVLSNFSLLLLPSTYKKCVSGTRRAHDGKCRLIIKLRGRARSQSGL